MPLYTNITEASPYGTLVLAAGQLGNLSLRSAMDNFFANQPMWKEVTNAVPTPIALRPFASTLLSSATTNIAGLTITMYDSTDPAIATIGKAKMMQWLTSASVGLVNPAGIIGILRVIDSACADPAIASHWTQYSSQIGSASAAPNCLYTNAADNAYYNPIYLNYNTTASNSTKTTIAAQNFGFICNDDYTIFIFSVKSLALHLNNITSVASGPFIVVHPQYPAFIGTGNIPRIGLSQLAASMEGGAEVSHGVNQNDIIFPHSVYGVTNSSGQGTFVMTPPMLVTEALITGEFPLLRAHIVRVYPTFRGVSEIIRGMYFVKRAIYGSPIFKIIDTKKHMLLIKNNTIGTNSNFCIFVPIEA